MPKGKIDLDAKYADFERDGYVIFENVIEPDLVAEIKDALLRVERDNDMGFRDTDFEGKRTVRIYNLLAHGPTFWKIPVHEATLPFAEKVLDEELQVSSVSSITLCPGCPFYTSDAAAEEDSLDLVGRRRHQTTKTETILRHTTRIILHQSL